ncbi:ribosomal protection-like ABC-F family protein [Companilactobacillus alimentarius]|uniref:ABC-F type ribosomal protection protein n=1 Tax=Companilactobacillus alimentarius DSM 20249 TaxID=1423720 RepID=A0A2K9HNK4_9LACO|nr:ATP-binding cassette domain-containing protein [Companilactobacillus alimentarius]AUI71803.1 ABC-F type ribosomal protection protein [Companilactobacillus alimentarius DSM 20249]KRK75469.1 ABC transporter-like protein [Companilactobacillus alimentarius DSM 20249]MDT6952322.1 ATP-binding cassette domain-containing protein [Companilactobacillus alimentarius]GEO45909.1 Lsa family ABC-F type ribosomal protection protein [Companilactobacillus alimentarius]
MGTIQIENVSFKYDQMADNLFNTLNLKIDESWKLGLIGRNGRGKTTLMKMLLGQLQYRGQIISNLNFYYYPQTVVDKNIPTVEVVKNLAHLEDYDLWKIEIELEKLQVDVDILQQEFSTLSPGEKTKVLLAILFVDESGFQLIDEPTNHLDVEGRKIVSEYLKGKKGFIVISHDKSFLNPVIDHVISIDRSDVAVYKGNFDTWQKQWELQNQHEVNEKVQLQKDINRLHETAVKRENWSRQTEAHKNRKQYHEKVHLNKGFIGTKAAKMMKKAKTAEKRVNSAIDEKKTLLKNIEIEAPLELNYEKRNHPDIFVQVENLKLRHEDIVTPEVNFKVKCNQVVSLVGPNGIGKTTIFRQIMGLSQPFTQTGNILMANNLKISYLRQDNELKGTIRQLSTQKQIEPELVFSNLRKLGFERYLFEQPIEQMSQGQRRKVALAVSLSEEANLYFWDEPLNYLDVITRQQIIEAIKKQHPTMLLIDHDIDLINSVSSKKIELRK